MLHFIFSNDWEDTLWIEFLLSLTFGGMTVILCSISFLEFLLFGEIKGFSRAGNWSGLSSNFLRGVICLVYGDNESVRSESSSSSS